MRNNLFEALVNCSLNKTKEAYKCYKMIWDINRALLPELKRTNE